MNVPFLKSLLAPSEYQAHLSDLTSNHINPSLIKPKHHLTLEFEPSTESSIFAPKFNENVRKYPYANYRKDFELIKKMRAGRNAPHDSYGTSVQFCKTDPHDTQGFQILVSLLLSEHTREHVCDLVMRRLLQKGLSVDFVNEIDFETLKNLIFEINYNGKKAKLMKKTADMLKREFNGRMPEKCKDLLRLPGVEPKTVILFMKFFLNRDVGLYVDFHIHRIANLLRWVRTRTAEESRRELEQMFPKDEWSELGDTMIGFGQMVCFAERPRCYDCLLKDSCLEGIRSLRDPEMISSKKMKKI